PISPASGGSRSTRMGSSGITRSWIAETGCSPDERKRYPGQALPACRWPRRVISRSSNICVVWVRARRPGRRMRPSLRGANGSRERAPDDRLRDEAIQSLLAALDCFAPLAMTAEIDAYLFLPSIGVIVSFASSMPSMQLTLRATTSVPSGLLPRANTSTPQSMQSWCRIACLLKRYSRKFSTPARSWKLFGDRNAKCSPFLVQIEQLHAVTIARSLVHSKRTMPQWQPGVDLAVGHFLLRYQMPGIRR